MSLFLFAVKKISDILLLRWVKAIALLRQSGMPLYAGPKTLVHEADVEGSLRHKNTPSFPWYSRIESGSIEEIR